MKRKACLLLALSIALTAALIVPGSIRPAHAVNTFQTCDLFAGIGNGRIAWWRPNACGIPTSMTFQGFIVTGIPNTFMTGMAFNSPSCALGPGHPCLYATMFSSQAVSIFDNTGTFLGTCGTGYSLDPESMVIDTVSTPHAIYVGQADGTHNILKFKLDCTPGTPPFFAPSRESRGTDWIDLVAPDSSDGGSLCDIQYTSEGSHVLTFDVCSNTQEANLDSAPLPGSNAYAHRQLTTDHSVLVGDTQLVAHLDSSGHVIATCDSSTGILFALNVLPGSKEFVTSELFSGKTDYFTIPHCDAGNTTPDFTFNAIPPGCTGTCVVGGLAVFGEATAVSQLRTTTTTVTCNPPSVAVNQATTCTATVTDTSSGPPTAPTGTVSFSSTGSGVFSSPNCFLHPTSPSASSCSVNYTPNPGSEGTHTITATYPGDSNHSGSSGSTALQVTKRSTTTSVNCSPGTVPVNSPTTCTATVTDTSPGIALTPSGTVTWNSNSAGTFSSSSCILHGAGAVATCSVSYTPSPGSQGTTTITAIYGGDTDHFGSQGSTTITVTRRPTSTTVNCNPGTVPVNAPTSCTATVTDTGPGTTIPPTGMVSFTSTGSGTFSFTSCLLIPLSSSASSCSVNYTPNPGSEGTHTIKATYNGDPNHSGSSGTFDLTVTKRTTSTSVTCSPNFVQPGVSTTCQATVTDTSPGTFITPTGTVTWTTNATGTFSPSNSCTLTGTGPSASCTVTYTPTSRGVHLITATYQGDTDHFGSSGSTTLAVGVPPRSAVTDSSLCSFDRDPNVFGQQFTLIFIEDPANPGTFELTASNPGQFYYNVFYNGPAGSPVSLAIRIPYPFVTQGSVPIQEFSQVSFNSQGCFVPSGQLTGFTVSGTTTTTSSGATSITLDDYTPQAMGSFVTLTVSGTVPATGLVYVTIHLDYGLKTFTGYVNTNNNAVNTDSRRTVPQLQSYTFSYNTLVGNPTQTDSQTVQSENVFKGCGKGFCGVVTDSQGTPVQGVSIQIYNLTGQLIGTVTTDQYGFYSFSYTLLGTNLATFIVMLPGHNIQQTVTLALNSFTVANFTIP